MRVLVRVLVRIAGFNGLRNEGGQMFLDTETHTDVYSVPVLEWILCYGIIRAHIFSTIFKSITSGRAQPRSRRPLGVTTM